MKVSNSIKAVALMVALLAGVQAQAQQSGKIAGLSPAAAAAAGVGILAGGFLIADALEDDDDDGVAPVDPVDPVDPPTTTTTTPVNPPATTTST